MSEDPLEAFARATAEGSQAAFKARINKERRTQNRSRMIRRTLRWSILGLSSLSGALLYFAQGGWQALGALGILITLIMMGALFLMGGIAPLRVRAGLSKRERKLLDD
jgi:hypothetical protein